MPRPESMPPCSPRQRGVPDPEATYKDIFIFAFVCVARYLGASGCPSILGVSGQNSGDYLWQLPP